MTAGSRPRRAVLYGERTHVLLIEGHTDGPEDSAFSRGMGANRRATFSAALRP